MGTRTKNVLLALAFLALPTKVLAQIARSDPALAVTLLQAKGETINALTAALGQSQ